jgi:hypothetical protein
MKKKMTMEERKTKVLVVTQKVRQEIERERFLGRQKLPSKLSPLSKVNNVPLNVNKTPLEAEKAPFKLSPCMVA